MLTDAELLAKYASLNLKLIYWPRVGDDPRQWKGPHEAGWNDPTRKYDLSKYDSSVHNLGVICGCEVATGKFLVDADLDWAPGLPLAAKLLPQTRFAMGRKGKKLSHACYTSTQQLPTVAFCDVADEGEGDGATFIEIRCGSNSHQSMIAPSLHSPGVKIELVLQGDILHVEPQQIMQAAQDYAIACLILARVKTGLHHAGRLPLAGFLLRAGLSSERVVAILENVCALQAANGVPDMSSKDVQDCGLVVRSIMKQIDAGKKAQGGPSFAEWLGGDLGKRVLKRLNKYLGRNDDFVRDNNGKILPKHFGNLERAIQVLGHELSFNEFSGRQLCDGKALEDREANTILTKIEVDLHFQPPDAYFQRNILVIAWAKPFHPVRDYLKTLTWDGKPRIDEWLIHAADVEDSAYTRKVSRIVLMAAVCRVMHPGCKYDEMLVLESPTQGTDKSSAIAALCPERDWFSDDLPLNVDSKQMIERTLGKWIIEASDLSGKRKTEIESLKAMLSRQRDGPARLAYAHHPVERDRQFIIIGTTNSPEYLPDVSNRRFWPMRIRKRFDMTWLASVRDQLWAEAAAAEAAGESIRLPEELWPAATVQQEKRREQDAWEGVFRDVLLNVKPSGDKRRRISTTLLWESLAIPVERRDRSASLRITNVMTTLGFSKSRIREEGSVVIGFVEDTPLNELALEADDDEEADEGRRKDDVDL